MGKHQENLVIKSESSSKYPLRKRKSTEIKKPVEPSSEDEDEYSEYSEYSSDWNEDEDGSSNDEVSTEVKKKGKSTDKKDTYRHTNGDGDSAGPKIFNLRSAKKNIIHTNNDDQSVKKSSISSKPKKRLSSGKKIVKFIHYESSDSDFGDDQKKVNWKSNAKKGAHAKQDCNESSSDEVLCSIKKRKINKDSISNSGSSSKKESSRQHLIKDDTESASENQNDGEVFVNGEDAGEENVIRARVLASDSDGQSIYGFVTPKRKDALAKIAQDVLDSSRKLSKKSSKNSSVSDKKSSGKKTLKGTTSKGGKETTSESDVSAGRRMKNRVTLAHTLVYNESDESGESDEGDSETDGSDSDESSASKKKIVKDQDILDEYFEVHSKSTSLTSDKTLAKLQRPKMDQQELRKHLKDIQSTHLDETLKLHNMHHQHFQTWMFQLLSGFNVLLYGLGSKLMLLEKFRKEMLKDKVHIVINGFFPSIQLKQILKMITEDIMSRDIAFKNIISHYKYIKEEYDSGTAGKLFIILHNIDGHVLRSQMVQSVLGYIASSSNIHLIASIDHINAPLMWDQNRASAFNWVWYDVTTFEPYSEETSYENSLMVQQSGTLALSSLKHVLHSLTSNAKGIFRLLTDYHMDNEDNTSYHGMSFNDLYQRCRERFLVNSDLALRAQLTEFKDHKLVKTKKGFDGIEYLSVALDYATLKMFLEEEDG